MLLNYLKDLGVKHNLFEHKSAITVKSAKEVYKNIKGFHCKNLFMKDSKRKNYFLGIFPINKEIELKKLRKILKAKKLGMARREELEEILKISFGNLSTLGLINDEERKVILVIDEEIMSQEIITLHPNNNTKTVQLNKENFKKLLESFENEKRIINYE